LRLAGVVAACAVVDSALAEREPVPRLFEAFTSLLDAVDADPGWAAQYVRWEVYLLAELGYGLDLGCCAVSGAMSGLVYVSPRTGRAVSQEAGAAWKDRLLALPAFLLDSSAPADRGAVAVGLALTGYFLRRHVYGGRGHDLPAARTRFAVEMARADPPPQQQ
jgi:DNA repair protein RecO (recombination protein O)